MAWRLCSRRSLLSSICQVPNLRLQLSLPPRFEALYDSALSTSTSQISCGFCPKFQGKLCPQVSCIDSILMPLDLLNLVKNLAWLGPDGSEDLQLDKAALLPPLYLEATMLDPVVRPTNNPATTRIPLKICSCNPRISTKSR